MKTENKLRQSYDAQFQIFLQKKELKEKNLTKRREEIQLKLQTLQRELNTVNRSLEENQQKTFLSFEEFFRQAREKSEQTLRAKKLSEEPLSSNQTASEE